MRSNIETIKFTGTFSFLFAVLAYIVTLNNEIGFFQPNWWWMSNSFALTVCGGAFTSFLVVLLCEVQKYKSNKQSCENYLYTQTEYLYCMLYLISRNVDEYMANQSMPVTDNLLDERLMMICSIITPFSCSPTARRRRWGRWAASMSSSMSGSGWPRQTREAWLWRRCSAAFAKRRTSLTCSRTSSFTTTLAAIRQRYSPATTSISVSTRR